VSSEFLPKKGAKSAISAVRVSPATNGTISLLTCYGYAQVPFVIQRPSVGWPQAGVRRCVFQVVKTAQSRGRTERTLGNLCSPQAPLQCAGMLRADVIRHFRCHITVLLHRSHHADKR